jgi:hypothetical protein
MKGTLRTFSSATDLPGETGIWMNFEEVSCPSLVDVEH